MEDLYKIVNKQEFNSLYRFGKIPYIKSELIPYTEEEVKLGKAIEHKFEHLAYFDGDEEYLIIKIVINEEDSGWIQIEDVTELIPLTHAAKASYERKFDPRLIFTDPVFDNEVKQVERSIEIEDKLQGANALCKILGLESFVKYSVDRGIVERSFDSRIDGLKSEEIKEEFFTHLIVYERYEFFPNTDLGYFYDIGELFAHSCGKPTFRGSGFYTFLETNKECLKYEQLSKLIKYIEEKSDTKPFREHLTSNGQRNYITAALYLKMKEELAGKDSVMETRIKDIVEWILSKGDYTDEMVTAVCLVGCFFGYKKFYSDLYENVGLTIFKNKGQSPKVSDSKSNNQIEREIGEDENLLLTKEKEGIVLSNQFDSSNGNIEDRAKIGEKTSPVVTNENETQDKVPEETTKIEQIAELSEKEMPQERIHEWKISKDDAPEKSDSLNSSQLSDQDKKAISELLNLIDKAGEQGFEVKGNQNIKIVREILKGLSEGSYKNDLVNHIKEKYGSMIIVIDPHTLRKKTKSEEKKQSKQGKLF